MAPTRTQHFSRFSLFNLHKFTINSWQQSKASRVITMLKIKRIRENSPIDKFQMYQGLQTLRVSQTFLKDPRHQTHLEPHLDRKKTNNPIKLPKIRLMPPQPQLHLHNQTLSSKTLKINLFNNCIFNSNRSNSNNNSCKYNHHRLS